MNKDIFEGEWKALKGKAKEQWGKLTDDDLTQINGKKDQLIGKLQQRYGYAREKAEQEIKQWETTWEESRTASARPSSPQDRNASGQNKWK